MDRLTKQLIDKQRLNVFLRDISSDSNVNLKHMVEDEFKKEKEKKSKKKNYNKKKVVKKKELIILEQNAIRKKKNIEEDHKKIKFYLETIDFKKPFMCIKKLKTDEGKTFFKKELLKELWNQESKSKNINIIILLYYDLINCELDDEGKNIVESVCDFLEEYDIKLFMMKKMGNMLPPLNNYDNPINTFDKWQKDVINLVNNKESIIVKAPTSSGKSFIAMSTGIIHKKILYVCPAKPVAYQVGSNYIYMGYKVHFLLDNISHYSYNSDTNIFIGTPKEIENNINRIGVDFDYAVFDEIHNLNKEEDGHIYENIIKTVKCNFLALSASILNIDFLKEIFTKIHPDKVINYVEYNKRFINNQRWVWDSNNKLTKIHPLSVCETINDINKYNISFTPNDCSHLWEKLEEVFESDEDIVEDFSPDEFFKDNKLISLDDCKEYEIFIKNKLIELGEKHLNRINNILGSFKQSKVSGKNLLNMIKETKNKNMLPMIMFHTNENKCKSIFYNLYEEINNKENLYYPYHYEILEKKESLYQNYLNSKDIFKSNIKISSSSTNAQFDIKEKLENFDKRERDKYISCVIQYYNTCINNVNMSDNDSRIKNIQKNNLEKERNEFILNPDFSSQDIYQKHPDFVYTISNEPMSADTIREVRRQIKNTLNIKIPYESPLFQMLKRGIGLYIENAPDEYNWILQKLLSNKEIGVVISDKTLCLGIDLPVRTTCFLGIDNSNFSNEEYIQMSGRAGRRGKDTVGNIIFFGDLDYINMMKLSDPILVGSRKSLNENYKISNIYQKSDDIFKNMINNERTINRIKIDDHQYDKRSKSLLWILREYKNAIYFIEELSKIENDLLNTSNTIRDNYLLERISKLIDNNDYHEIKDSYKIKKIHRDNIKQFINYLDVVMNIYNNLGKEKYNILHETLKILFTNINQMIFNFII